MDINAAVKPTLGCTPGRTRRSAAMASARDKTALPLSSSSCRCCRCISQAAQTAAERDIPWAQCTRHWQWIVSLLLRKISDSSIQVTTWSSVSLKKFSACPLKRRDDRLLRFSLSSVEQNWRVRPVDRDTRTGLLLPMVCCWCGEGIGQTGGWFDFFPWSMCHIGPALCRGCGRSLLFTVVSERRLASSRRPRKGDDDDRRVSEFGYQPTRRCQALSFHNYELPCRMCH
jgi:hypothetical protein